MALCVTDRRGRITRDYMKALCCRFETTSRRAEYLGRKIEWTYRHLTRLLNKPEQKLLLKTADLENALREEACLNSFISGFRLAQGIQRGAAGRPGALQLRGRRRVAGLRKVLTGKKQLTIPSKTAMV